MRPTNDTFKNIMKVGKRIGITILICIPIMVAFGYLTRNVITADWAQILCFMAIMAVAVTIEELISRYREKKKKVEIETEPKRDVYKWCSENLRSV